MQNIRTNFRAWHQADLFRFSATQFILLALYCFEIVSNPLNLDSISDRVSADFYNYAFSPFYGQRLEEGRPYTDIRYGQDNILVVLIDDYFLQQPPGRSWPISPAQYKPILLKLSRGGSLAIFLDVYFQHGDAQRESEVADLINFANELPVPVYFASILADPVPEYAGISSRHYALAEMHAQEHTYAFQQTIDVSNMPKNWEELALSSEVGTEPQSHCIRSATDNTMLTCNTAAFSLYREWCQQTGCDNPVTPEEEEPELFVQWGVGPDSFYVREMENEEKCELRALTEQEALQRYKGENAVAPDNDSFLRAVTSTARILKSRVLTMNRPVNNPSDCLYHRKLGIETFMNLESEYAYTEDPLAQARAWTNGKIILLGTEVSLFRDITYSPVHLNIPGVFKIAMALDNMMELGDDYSRWVPDHASVKVEIIILIVVLGLFIGFNYWLHGVTDAVISDKLNMLFGMNMLLLLMLFVMTSIHISHWAPNNWISYILMYLMVSIQPMKSIWRFGQHRFWKPYFTNHLVNKISASLLTLLFMLIMLLSGTLIVIIPTLVLSAQAFASQSAYLLLMLLFSAALVLGTAFMVSLKRRQEYQLGFDF